MTTPEDQVATTEAPPITTGLHLTRIAGQCGAGTCPTIYRSDRETLVVQGYVVSGESAGVKVPDGEHLVEIPIEVLLTAADSLRQA